MQSHRRAYGSIALALVLLALTPSFNPPADAAGATIGGLTLSGSPFDEAYPPLPDRVTATARLTRRAWVTVRILTLDGTVVRTLASSVRLGAGRHTWTWDGRAASGSFAPDGIYELSVRAVTGSGEDVKTKRLRKGLPQIYPANPGAIVIAVDPGHGGRYPGACYQGFCEKDFNLDISLQLRALLERAGVQVVMTRTTDTAVDEPKSDVNGDGLANGFDDLVERNDIANQSRADLNIHIHNNAYGCRCVRGTETFTSFRQPWTPAGITLATLLQGEQLFVLEQFRGGNYYPVDRSVKRGKYHYMSPFDVTCPTASSASDCQPPYQPRPVLMPSVLTESLFVNSDIELALLKRADVRLSLAASFYIAIADYLNARDHGVAYSLVDGPAPAVQKGSAQTYRLRVTNRGNQPSSGWTLLLGAVPAVPLYDGSGAGGTIVGSAPIADGLQPGESVVVAVDVVAPDAAGSWLVKSDIRIGGATYLSDTGVVPLQLPLATTN